MLCTQGARHIEQLIAMASRLQWLLASLALVSLYLGGKHSKPLEKDENC